MKIRLITAATVLAMAAIPGLAAAQDTGFAVRLGGTFLHPANQSDPIVDAGGTQLYPSDSVQVANKTLPELDVLYSFTPNLVAELVLSYPQTFNVTLNNPGIVGVKGSLGTFKALPPTLLAQWHFLPKQQFDPYVGAGINWTWITPVHIAAQLPLDLGKSSFGAAFQAGLDYNLDKNWFLNADVKYIYPLQTELTLDLAAVNTNGKVSEVKLNPMLYSLGVGYRF